MQSKGQECGHKFREFFFQSVHNKKSQTFCILTMLHLVCSILGMNFKCAQIKLSRAVRRIIAAGEEKAELAK